MLRQKSEALEKFKKWTVLMENQVGRKVKGLKTDNGLNFAAMILKNFARSMAL